jgi:hypothetical protein
MSYLTPVFVEEIHIVIPCCLSVIFHSSKLDIQILEYLDHNTTRNTVIGYALSKAVHLEPFLEYISIAVQDLKCC